MGEWQGGWGPVTSGFKVASRCGSPGSLRPGSQSPLLYPSRKLRESVSVGTGNPESCQRKKSRAPQTSLTQNQALRNLGRTQQVSFSLGTPRRKSKGRRPANHQMRKPNQFQRIRRNWIGFLGRRRATKQRYQAGAESGVQLPPWTNAVVSGTGSASERE